MVRYLGEGGDCSLVGQPAGRPVVSAILHNGTAIRALDCNDVFWSDGEVHGHPSDNIAAALAFAEMVDASGLDYIRAIAAGYELYWRLQHHLLTTSPSWDHVSASGMVTAAVAGILLELDVDRLTDAIAIGAAHSYTLGQIRFGSIPMAKASANAVASVGGALAALMAKEGVTGPPEILEGKRGLVPALGLPVQTELLEALTAPVEEWHILHSCLKPYPAVGTAQAAIEATIRLVERHDVDASTIEAITIHLADSETNRSHIADKDRADPRSHEAADHSLPFLVAVAAEDRDAGVAQFRDERWLRPGTRALMARIAFDVDPLLRADAYTAQPAVATCLLATGERLQERVLAAPGAPNEPLSAAEINRKFLRITGQAAALPVEISDAMSSVAESSSMRKTGAVLRRELQPPDSRPPSSS